MERCIQAHKGFLGCVFSVRSGTGHLIAKPDNRSLVSLHYFGERIHIASGGLCYKFPVIRFNHNVAFRFRKGKPRIGGVGSNGVAMKLKITLLIWDNC